MSYEWFYSDRWKFEVISDKYRVVGTYHSKIMDRNMLQICEGKVVPGCKYSCKQILTLTPDGC